MKRAIGMVVVVALAALAAGCASSTLRFDNVTIVSADPGAMPTVMLRRDGSFLLGSGTRGKLTSDGRLMRRDGKVVNLRIGSDGKVVTSGKVVGTISPSGKLVVDGLEMRFDGKGNVVNAGGRSSGDRLDKPGTSARRAAMLLFFINMMQGLSGILGN